MTSSKRYRLVHGDYGIYFYDRKKKSSMTLINVLEILNDSDPPNFLIDDEHSIVPSGFWDEVFEDLIDETEERIKKKFPSEKEKESQRFPQNSNNITERLK